MSEEENIRSQIIGVDNPKNIVNVKMLSGEVELVKTVIEKMKAGQKFSVVDPETHEVVDVIAGDDGTLRMKGGDGNSKTLDKLPTFT